MEINNCPCCSGRSFQECCEPIITKETKADTPEALMRSRYTAYTLGDVDHIVATSHPDNRKNLDIAKTREWSEQSQWKKLDIVDAPQVSETAKEGYVEFIAYYDKTSMRERSRFVKEKGCWYYCDGQYPQPETVVKEHNIGRNDPCHCGSGKKYKKCCIALLT